MAESFGRLLQRYRVAAGLSQENLAERAGISTNAVSSLERGLRHAPHSATLDLLIAALKLDGDARIQIEEAARLARAGRIQTQRGDLRPDVTGEGRLNNLTPEVTSFVDRAIEVPEIKGLLRSFRLVTVVGSGGAGKSRCALKIAGDMLASFVDGVWAADLTAISDPSLVSTVIAGALRLQEAPNRPMLETLSKYLKRKQLLLILDNCEHVIEETRRVVAALLSDCPNIGILATSRESLSIAGEHAYRMPSLPVPSDAELLSANEMSEYGAVQLFNDRAFSADSQFTLTVDNAPHVAEICRRLDGMPLAIELAAARVKILTPKQLAQKLEDRFRILTAGDRDALPRHRTMRALIDWSYDLLSDDERRLFRKLSIFVGGFTVETAASVCEEGAADEITIVDLLSSLVDKSLVHVDIVEGDTRFRLLESTRQYAREKLKSADEEDGVAQAHARAFLRLAEQLSEAWEITADREWHGQVAPELDNFRAAFSWAFGVRGDVLLGQLLACHLRRVWYAFGPAEGWRCVQAAQQRVTAETPAEIIATLELAESAFWTLLNRYKASLESAERALLHYRDLGDSYGMAMAERQIGTALVFLGKIEEGEPLLERSLRALQAFGKRRSAIIALHFLASARILAGDLNGARARLSETLAATHAFGGEAFGGFIWRNFPEVEFRDGNAAEALRLANEALADARASGNALRVADVQQYMAAYLVSLHRLDEARAIARDAAIAACDAQFAKGVASALQHLAAIAALRPSADAPVIEDRRRAARILGFVDSRFVTLETSREYTDQQEYDAIIPALRDALGGDEVARFMREGANWSEDRAIAEAKLI